MLNSIMISKYTLNDVLFSKLNPICKILSFIFFTIIVLNINNLYLSLLLFLILILLLFINKIPFNEYLKSLKLVLYLLICIFVINLLLNVKIEDNLLNILRIIEIIIYTTIISITTSEKEFLYSFITIFKPLNLFRINTNMLGLVFTIILRFIPIIIDTLNMAIRNVKSKGIDTKKNKILVLKSIILPTFNSTIKKADNLSDAMEIRLYNYNDKGYNVNYLNIYDIILIIVNVILLIEVIICDI